MTRNERRPVDENGDVVLAKRRASTTGQTTNPVIGQHHQRGGTPIDATRDQEEWRIRKETQQWIPPDYMMTYRNVVY